MPRPRKSPAPAPRPAPADLLAEAVTLPLDARIRFGKRHGVLRLRLAARAQLTPEAQAVADLLELSAWAWESLRLARDEAARGRPAGVLLVLARFPMERRAALAVARRAGITLPPGWFRPPPALLWEHPPEAPPPPSVPDQTEGARP
jgi:hypothetical protein